MAVFSVGHLWVLAILAIAGIFIAGNNAVSGQVQCHVNMQDLLTQCWQYIQKSGPQIDPSQGCCRIVRRMDVPCFCNFVTPEVEQMISADKAVHVIAFCGVPLHHGMKCGSYTIP